MFEDKILVKSARPSPTKHSLELCLHIYTPSDYQDFPLWTLCLKMFLRECHHSLQACSIPTVSAPDNRSNTLWSCRTCSELRQSPVKVASSSHYLHTFEHDTRWCISSRPQQYHSEGKASQSINGFLWLGCKRSDMSFSKPEPSNMTCSNTTLFLSKAKIFHLCFRFQSNTWLTKYVIYRESSIGYESKVD